MANTMERVIPVPNETEASFSRTTSDGRKITYELKVLQQPERARACGSGAKSSADRRPVDPPPIVKLLIKEGEKAENDITFLVNANYFLFATLEQARPIAHGRVAADDPSRLTVLTGTPVAGMVYLDRPEPGGYFIFPDLSVRHEGKYRLGFSLYEELKTPKDFDLDDDPTGRSQGESHITHRLEVKSQPFMVYSAKKFPGLKSSTQLSRTVAEQGCRVRIRREVRMRRREKKGEYDGCSDGGYERSRHSATPDVYQSRMAGVHPIVEQSGRERSASIGSHASTAAAPVSRRTSGHDMAPAYPQASYVPQSVAQPAAAQPIPPTQHQYPQQHFALQYVPQQPPMQHPQMHYPQYPYPQAHAPPPAQPAPQHSYYGHAPPMGHAAQYEEYANGRNSGADYAVSASSDSRRPSMVQPPTYSHATQAQSYPTQYASVNGHVAQQTPKMRQMSQISQLSPPASAGVAPHALPPIDTKLALRETKFEISPPASAVSQPHYYGMRCSGPPQIPVETGPTNGKRSYDRVFDSRHLNAPLRQGARPSISHGSGSLLADDGNDNELAELENLKMSYRRADGREIARPLPPSM